MPNKLCKNESKCTIKNCKFKHPKTVNSDEHVLLTFGFCLHQGSAHEDRVVAENVNQFKFFCVLNGHGCPMQANTQENHCVSFVARNLHLLLSQSLKEDDDDENLKLKIIHVFLQLEKKMRDLNISFETTCNFVLTDAQNRKLIHVNLGDGSFVVLNQKNQEIILVQPQQKHEEEQQQQYQPEQKCEEPNVKIFGHFTSIAPEITIMNYVDPLTLILSTFPESKHLVSCYKNVVCANKREDEAAKDVVIAIREKTHTKNDIALGIINMF